MSESMIVDGIAASEAIDSSGEILDVAGCDISDLEKGLGVLNFEHRDEKSPGHSVLDIIGKVIFAKKIFKKSDCSTERETEYWDKVQLPFIYHKSRLFDGTGHPAAIAAAAIFRDAIENDEPVITRYSIEGATLKKVGHRLEKSIARRIALTIKPCNRSATSGVVSDPHVSGGFVDDVVKESKEKEKSLAHLADTKKSERLPHPSGTRLGGFSFKGSPVVTLIPLDKTLTAGVGSAAPGELTGGAALQVEDRNLRKRKLVERVVKAITAWDKQGDVREYLKNELPDVDPDFVDKFAEMADDFKVKASNLRKDEAPVLPAKSAPPVKKPALPKVSRGGTMLPPKASRQLSDKPVAPKDQKIILHPKYAEQFKITKGPRPTPKSPGQSYLDSGTGILHTHLGSFPMYIPKDSAYVASLSGREVAPHHDEAMKHWKNLNALLREGRLPPEIMMHAALFSGMSPTVPVPMQEIAFSHLKDMMHAGMDPSAPGGVTEDHRNEFMSRIASGGQATLPNFFHDYWAGPSGTPTRTKADGVQKGLLYPDGKWGSVEGYHRLHPILTSLAQKYGTDGRAIAHELLLNTDSKDTQGFAPKTVRYLLGMFGAGNIHVPDTHYIRHSFGTPSDKQIKRETLKWLGRSLAPDERIFAPSDHLKSILWESNNAKIGEDMDRFYYHNHPAVKHTIDRHFGGVPDEQAIFPSFWAHWLSIASDEKRRKIHNENSNDATDHRVYWGAVNEILQKHGLSSVPLIHKSEPAPKSLAERTAAAHADVTSLFGENPGLLFYYKHCVPLLLQEHDRKKNQTVELDSSVMKMEAALIDLRKANWFGSLFAKKPPAPERRGTNMVVPGKIKHVDGETMEFLGREDGHAIIRGKTQGLGRYHLAGEGTHFHVLQEPKITPIPSEPLDSKVHGIAALNRTPEQEALIHGTDLDKAPVSSPKNAKSGINAHTSHWRKMANGKLAYIKAPGRSFHDGHVDTVSEVAYTNVARDIFGLGDYVPLAAGFKHPVTGDTHAVIEAIENGEHYSPSDDSHVDELTRLHENGEIHKLAIMNQVMANGDRHNGNYMFSRQKDGSVRLKLIDHGLALFPHRHPTGMPYYLSHTDAAARDHMAVTKNVADWAEGLDHTALEEYLGQSGLPASHANRIAERLRKIKDTIVPGEHISDMFDVALK